MASQSTFENIDLDEHSGASRAEMLTFCRLYIKPIIRQKGSEGSRTKGERFRTEWPHRGCSYRVPWQPGVCESQGFGAGDCHGH